MSVHLGVRKIVACSQSPSINNIFWQSSLHPTSFLILVLKMLVYTDSAQDYHVLLAAALSVVSYSVQPLLGLLWCDIYKLPSKAVLIVLHSVVDRHTRMVTEYMHQLRIVD